MRVINVVVILVWILIGVYFGVGGWLGTKVLQSTTISEDKNYEYDGLSFAGQDQLNEFLLQKTWGVWFPWLFAVNSLAPLIAAIAFGLIGASARQCREMNRGVVSTTVVLMQPPFGAMMGALIYFMALIVPTAFMDGSTPLRTETLIGTALFGGMFSERSYLWIEAQIAKVFPTS